jgi:putative transposase
MLKIAPKHKSRFKHHCSSPEFIMLVVYMKCRFSLSYREIEELLEIRGGKVDHATVARWVYKFTPLIDQKIRKRKRAVSGSWRMDETYIKVGGKWCYLYRAVVNTELL